MIYLLFVELQLVLFMNLNLLVSIMIFNLEIHPIELADSNRTNILKRGNT